MEQETLKKLDEMKYIMEETRKTNKDIDGCTGDTRPSHRVGIFTEVGDNDFGWLHGALSSHYFSNVIKTIRFIDTSDIDLKKLLEQISSCTFYIFIGSGYHRGTFSAIRQKIGFIFESKNLIIILQNLQDSTDREKRRILQENRDYIRHKENLILFSKMEQGSNFLSRLVNDHPPRSMRGKSKGFTEEHYSQGPEIKHHTVGIFSRSSDRDYSWLVTMLRSEDFHRHVSSVQSYIIYNNQSYQKFLDTISQCTFGILYHSKNRGLVNVTNVTDSLYDQELETLYMIIGKENVLVIIDDLEDSSDSRKTWILQEQHSIVEWAADLLLVSHNDKKDRRILRQKMNNLKTLLQGPELLQSKRGGISSSK